MDNLKRILVLSLLSILLLISSCGFHLRGSAELPAWLSPLYIAANSPYSEFLTEVRRQLESNGLELTEQAAQSEYKLVIKNISTQERTLAVDSSIDGSEFQLQMAVVYELIGPQGKFLIGPEARISASRIYQQNSNEIAKESGQISNLKGDVYKGLALQIIWRLQALQQPNTQTSEAMPVISEDISQPAITPSTNAEPAAKP